MVMSLPTLSALRLDPVVSVDATASESFHTAFRIIFEGFSGF